MSKWGMRKAYQLVQAIIHLNLMVEVSVSNIDTDSDFAAFFSPSKKIAGNYFNLGHDSFIPRPFQFIALYYSTIRRYAHIQTETLMTSLTKPQQQDN
jgi:hypothetical protein